MPSYDNGYANNYDKPVGKVNSRTSIYENDKINQVRDRNGNLSSMARNDYNAGSKNKDYNYGYNDGPALKEQSARNPIKARTQEPKPYNDKEYYNPKKPLNNRNQ